MHETARAAEQPEAAGGDAQDKGLPAPAALTDGAYRLVSSMDQTTGEGRIFAGGTGAASAWAYGKKAAENLSGREDFTGLMKALYPGCSITVKGGVVTDLILRPCQPGQRDGGNVTGLPAKLTEQLAVTIGVVTRQSSREGKATADSASLTFSVRLAKCAVSLGQDPVPDRENTPHFLSLDGSRLTINPKAREGAAAKIGVRSRDGTWRTLTFTKADSRRITVVYRAQDTLEP